jgi:hypothetical protein
MQDCVRKVKRGGYFYPYLYYSLDNRGRLFRAIFRISNVVGIVISSLPKKPRECACEFIAITVYMPLVLLVRGLKSVGVQERIYGRIPLSAYHDKSLFVIRNDARDRFGTRLEHRFSKAQVRQMMENCGLTDITFGERGGFLSQGVCCVRN